MISSTFETVMKRLPGLSELGGQIKQTLHSAVMKGGGPVRNVLDLLHGVWLGHPLHPVLTDVALGAWVMGALFDWLSTNDDSPHTEQAADTLIGVGAAAAVPTAVTGLADYSTISQRATGTGLLHGLLNTMGLGFYLLSLATRKQGNRKRGIALSTIGLALVGLGGWVGGHLVYKQRVGVNHAHPAQKPEEWQGVLNEADLEEQKPRQVDVGGNPVLLYRHQGAVFAIGAVCSHAGAPLEEGDFDGFCVQCPWHDSVFDLRDGSIVHGPATYQQPTYAARVNNGQIEIRAEQA